MLPEANFEICLVSLSLIPKVIHGSFAAQYQKSEFSQPFCSTFATFCRRCEVCLCNETGSLPRVFLGKSFVCHNRHERQTAARAARLNCERLLQASPLTVTPGYSDIPATVLYVNQLLRLHLPR